MQSINIWMQMLGFDRDDPDHGVARFLDRTGFTPDSVCALLFHCDFVNLHRGMDDEYVLFQDNCAYHGIPRNKERERQNWTNHDLRELVAELKKQGVDFYAGIMGSYVNDMYHHEWLTDHPEIRCNRRDKVGSIMCLKRLKDGTYYEDFFAKKLVETLVDYDMAGVHLSDSFCPSSTIYMSDYSTDMVDQFISHTGIKLSDEIMATMGDDETATINKRADYLWENFREEWIRFYEWRWEGFFRKVCSAAHAAGKKVWVLGMYCTDPFETCYIHAFDSKRVMDAGVDCITANILPTSVGLNAKGFPYFFHRMHMELPLVSAQTGNHQIVSMVGVQDASEEWSVLEHRPVLLERDVYTMTSFRLKDGDSYADATNGLFLCLGDGIDHYHWEFLKTRMDIGFSTDAQKVWSPMILWSDTANYNMLPAYIKNRRTTVHKQCHEIFKAGTPFGGSVRSDDLNGFDGIMFVPNFDLLSENEQKDLLNCDFSWVGTVPADYSVPSNATFEFEDSFSDFSMKAFSYNFTPSEQTVQKIKSFCAEDDGMVSTADEPELSVTALYRELPHTKLTKGFVESMGALLQDAMYKLFPVECNKPMMALRLKNGQDRLFLYNTDDDHYDHAIVTSDIDLESVNIASHYPVLPPRFLQEANTAFSFDYNKKAERTNKFQVKLAPGGLTIVDIKR